MSLMFRDRAFCARSRDGWSVMPYGLPSDCCNTACERYVDETVIRLAAKAKLPIGWADLKTSKCGFVPREAK